MTLARCLTLATAAWIGAVPCQAAGFRSAYEAALANDAPIRAARQELAASEHGIAIARAGLLPVISLSLSNSQVNGSRTAKNILGREVESTLDYRSPQNVLSLRAPLFNGEATQRHKLAVAQAELAGSVYLSRGHELLERLTLAYSQRLYVEQIQRAAQAQLLAVQLRRNLANRRLALGEGTRPELLGAEADEALAQTQVADARDQITIATLALRQITGLEEETLKLDPEISAWPAALDRTLEQWNELAISASPAIAARRQALEAARIAVARAQAGHYPRVDLVASVSSSRNDSASTLDQSVHQRAIGFQINIPLYNGGQVQASVLQALAEQEKAQAELDNEVLRVSADIQRLHLSLRAAPDRLDAQQKALAAALLAVQAVRRGIQGGIRIAPDIEQAEQKVTETRRDIAKTRLEWVLNRVRLLSRVGTPPEDIVSFADAAFATTRPPHPTSPP